MPAWLQFDWCSTCVLALGHFLWQGTLLGIAAAIALRVVTSTTARYWLSLSVLFVMAACPVATFTWLAQQSRSSTAAFAAAGTRSDARDARAVRSADESDAAIAARELPSGPGEPLDSRFSVDSRLPASASASESSGALGMSTSSTSASTDDRTWTRRLAPLVTSVYLGGVTLMLLRLALGLWGGRRLRRKATPVTEPALLAALQRQATALGLRLLPVLAYCERVTVPTVMGVLKPTILLPMSLASGLTPDQLESVLAHELAHLRRYDHLFNLVQRVIESLLFFHPAVWWVSQRVREEREQCCDDLVVACGATPLDYARSLLRVAELSRLAERRQAVRPSLATASLFATGDQPSKLRQRIARLLDDSRDARESHVRLRQRWPVVALVAVCCVLGVVVANTGWHWANEAWAGFSADERRDAKTEAGLGQPSNPAATQAKEPAATTAPPDGLEFLKPYPKLHGLSLDMTDPITLRQPSVLLPDHWILQAVALDRGGREIVTASNQSFITIRRWDRASMKLISEIKLQGDKHGRSVRHETLRFSGDRRRVIAATDAYVGIWDATTGQLLKRLPFPAKEGIYDCAIDLLDCTPDLSLIVGHRALPGRLTLSYDAHLIVWDGATGDVLRTVIDPGATDLKSLDLSTDGKRLVTTNGNGAKVWETSSGKLLRFIPNDNSGRNHTDPDVSSQYTNHVWSVQFSPDGKLLATGDILGVNLIDADTGKLVRHIEGPYRYSSSMSPGLIFSPDGRWLARLGTQEAVDEKADAKRGAKVEKSGDAKTAPETDRKSDEKKRHRYVVPIWSTETGARHFELHTEANDAQFSGDGRELAVVFSDMQQALSLWTLSGEAAGVEKPAGPGPHSRQDRVEENGHHVGKKAAEYVEQFKPTWGVAQEGLQYGVALTAPRRQFRAGERVPLVAFFRNAGDKPLKFNTAPDFFGNSPQVVNAKGESLALENIPLLGHVPHYHEKLEPGEVLGPFYMSFGLGDNPRPGRQHWHPLLKSPTPGEYRLSHTVTVNLPGPTDDATTAKKIAIKSSTLEFEIVAGAAKPQADGDAAVGKDSGKETAAANAAQPDVVAQPDTVAQPDAVAPPEVVVISGANVSDEQLAALQERARRMLAKAPQWLRDVQDKGVSANGDDNGDIVSIYIGRLATDELLSRLPSLPKLRELHIETTTGLTPAGLAHLGKLTSLTKVSFYMMNMEGEPLGDEAIRAVAGIKSLRELSIGECGTTDVGAKALEAMTQLTSLSLRQEGRMTDAALKSIGKLRQLKSLSLDSYVGTERFGWMRFSAAGLDELRGLTELESLHLVGQETTARVLVSSKLKSLSVGHAAVDDEIARRIAELSELQSLNLAYSRITDDGLSRFASLKKLSQLDISSESVTDAGLAAFERHPALSHINLRASLVTDKTLRSLTTIPTLNSLSLYGSGRPGFSPGSIFSIAGLTQLKTLPNLRTLSLTNLQLNGGYASLSELKQLKSLSFTMCDISDTDFETLDAALPGAMIHVMTGGGGRSSPPTKFRVEK